MTDENRTSAEAEVTRLRAELEACRAQLVHAHRLAAVGELLASIVHEINTPIGSILSNNEVSARSLEKLKGLLDRATAENAAPPPNAARILETLEKLTAVDKIACERIVSVVRGLKTFLGGKGSRFVKADVNEILRNTLKLAECEFRRRIQVETDFGAIPEIECEPNQLGQVFLNLLVNAGHAIEGEGKVTIRTRREGDSILVSISDNGSGIPPEHRAEIFSSGFTTKPAGIGTGFGLSISREIIVDGHGGTIDFETETGKGTTFHVRIPVSRPTGMAG